MIDKRFIARVRRRDRIASRIITVGGMIIIACVVGIILLIGKVALPLFYGADADIISSFSLPGNEVADVLHVGIDDYQEVVYTLDQKGVFTFFDAKKGGINTQVPVNSSLGRVVLSAERHKNSFYTLLWDDGSVTVCNVSFRLHFDDKGKRTVLPSVDIVDKLSTEAFPEKPLQVVTRKSEDGRFTVVALYPGNRFSIEHHLITTDLFDNEQKETFNHVIHDEISGEITAFTVDEQGKALFAGTDSGNVLRWDLSDNESVVKTDNVQAVPGGKPVTALASVFGDVSVAVGDITGGLTIWMPVRTEALKGKKVLQKIHSLKKHASAVTKILASRRTKTLVSIAHDGSVHYDHTTSENHLLRLGGGLLVAGIPDRGNSFVGIDKKKVITVWDVKNPHPEINMKTLFGRVWYEDYDKPEYVWQSSSSSDDFEPKFSIIPLLFGTIKGTLYAMLFAIPLSIFGAVYTSQFTTHFFKRTIKPVIEIMASVPSVVIGFLIALWLAPIVERQIMPILLSPILLVIIFMLVMALVSPFQKYPVFKNTTRGFEFLILVPVIFLTIAATVFLGPPIERWLFDGNFSQWLFSEAGMRYDQRNCIIIAFGLGITVIPIIFSITEDAITNIPPSLTAASLALGASRWQTIWRVILPSASPGIFAAIMIGFGRAVGETMIVLMATGNTPILDWSIFNGMRTLSANIAVEIPEAPLGGTLYRVLFLCSTILFILTFVLNTGAEVVREKLRKKYGRY